MPTLLDPAEVRAATLVDIDLGDDKFVRARRLDLSTMLIEGDLPLPLLTAARKFIESRHLEAAPEEAVTEVDHEVVLDTLRKHALLVIMEPMVTAEDDYVPDHLPVKLFTLPQLMAIWNATAVLPKVGAALAAEFRPREDVPAAHAVPARAAVRPTAKPVAPPAPAPGGGPEYVGA